MRRKWLSGALAVVAAGALVGATPAVAGASTTAATAPIAESASAQTIDEVREQFLQHGPGAEVMMVAHRGWWRAAPELSLSAIFGAVIVGAQVVEIDVRRTADGHLVLMYDSTVDRTTDGTGAVSELTLAEVKQLRLKRGLGGSQAPLTQERVPTLAEAMAQVKGRAMVNLDKAWEIRDEVYDVLVETDTLDHGIFKGPASLVDAQAFLNSDPEILYIHKVDDDNVDEIGAFTGRAPQAYEIGFDQLTDPQVQPSALAAAGSHARIWMNTLWYGQAARYTDETSLRDPAQGWGAVVNQHQANMIQTDNPEQLVSWLANRDSQWPSLPAGTVQVQAEDYSDEGKGIGYHDLDDENRGGTVARPDEGVDICDNQGAIVMCWIRGGEWVKYYVEVPESGLYRVSARMSSPYFPSGRFTMTFGDQSTIGPFNVVGTTSHNAFELREIEDYHILLQGAHEFTVRMDEAAYQNFNIDYFQFDLVQQR